MFTAVERRPEKESLGVTHTHTVQFFIAFVLRSAQISETFLSSICVKFYECSILLIVCKVITR